MLRHRRRRMNLSTLLPFLIDRREILSFEQDRLQVTTLLPGKEGGKKNNSHLPSCGRLKFSSQILDTNTTSDIIKSDFKLLQQDSDILR